MSAAVRTPLPRRPLGSSGVEVPILGLGTGPGGMGLTDAEAIGLYHQAIDLGVGYVDTAPGYRRAHAQLREVLRHRREEVFLATKAFASRRDTLVAAVARSLEELGVERVDLLYIHSLGEQPAADLFAGEGALHGLGEIKRRGWARLVGFTAHNRPGIAERAIREAPDLDVVMLAMNYVERHVYGFETRVVPLAKRRGVGVVAMKVFGGAPDMRYDRPSPSGMTARGELDHEAALRYALGIPGVSTAVVGVYTGEEIARNAAWARSFAPLGSEEWERLVERGRRCAPSWGARYGPVD